MSEAASIPSNEPMVEPTSRVRSIAIYAGYGLFFLAALLVSLVLTFPNRQLKGFVESQARKAGYPMVIEEMALTGLGGVALEGVDVTLPQPKGKNGKTKLGGEPTVLHLDKLSASVALWPLISRQEVDADFSLAVDDGGIEDGHVIVRQGVTSGSGGGGRGKRSRRGKRGKKGKKGAKKEVAAKGKKGGKKTTLIDLEIPSIDNLDLNKMGVASRALSFTNKVRGDLRGLLSGSISLHWEGTPEGAQGNIDLELTDAVLHNPAVAIDPTGPPLELRDLRLGVVTVKVRIDEKGRIALLKSKRGVDSSTAIHLAGVDIFGPDLELVAEERSHIIIPPGRSGMRQARMQVHLVFALPKAKRSRKKGGKSSEEGSARASWNMVREMMNGKFKRFMRSGYLGITCSGSLSRPTCVPSLPQVTVGTRKRARSQARAKAKKHGGAAAKKAAAAKKKALLEAAAKEAAAAKKKAEEAKKKAGKTIDGKKVEFKPAVRPGAKTTPTPRAGGKKGAVKTEQRNKKADDDELDEGDDEDDEADEGDDEEKDDRADDEDDEGDEGDEEGPDGAKKRAKKKGGKKRAAKKKRGADEDEGEEEE